MPVYKVTLQQNRFYDIDIYVEAADKGAASKWAWVNRDRLEKDHAGEAEYTGDSEIVDTVATEADEVPWDDAYLA